MFPSTRGSSTAPSSVPVASRAPNLTSDLPRRIAQQSLTDRCCDPSTVNGASLDICFLYGASVVVACKSMVASKAAEADMHLADVLSAQTSGSLFFYLRLLELDVIKFIHHELQVLHSFFPQVHIYKLFNQISNIDRILYVFNTNFQQNLNTTRASAGSRI